jgi:D-methionine transport system ATP-binding protein
MIEISGLTKRYGSHTVLDDIDFTVEPGSIAAVVGRSGAGKSTLFRCVNLLERPTAGTVRVDGQELTICPAGSCGWPAARSARCSSPRTCCGG